jgi:membrane-associated phospholipid phosphatase
VRRDVLIIAACLAGFAALTAGLAAGGPLIDLDLAVRSWSESHRPGVTGAGARALNLLGQGGPLLVIAWVLGEWLAVRTGSLRPPVYVLVATVLVAGTVLPVKAVTGRGAPSSPLPPERVVDLTGPLPPGEYAAGYPSGHVVNAVVWYGVLLVLVVALLRAHAAGGVPPAARAIVRVAPVVGVLAATTYLSYHWLTDGLAGLALGLAVDRALHLLPRRWRP